MTSLFESSWRDRKRLVASRQRERTCHSRTIEHIAFFWPMRLNFIATRTGAMHHLPKVFANVAGAHADTSTKRT
jgi:hypothetical protein